MKLLQNIVFFILFFTISACNPTHKGVRDESLLLRQPSCIDSITTCLQQNAFGQFELRTNIKKFVAEQPFDLFIYYSGDYKIKSITGFLEGVNMYMGKIPLIFKLKDNQPSLFSATAMFGICSEKKMIWRVKINVVLQQKNAKEADPLQTVQLIYLLTSKRS